MRETLIQERKNRGLTQAQVAKELGITRAYYGHIETGVRNPPLEHLHSTVVLLKACRNTSQAD